MSDLIDNGGYIFWDDDFSIQSAYEDCKAVFDGITDDDAFQECDTGIILYHAHEIMYALKKALPPAQPEQQWIPCSERLPKEYGNYLITTHNGDVDVGTIDPKKKGVWSACDADGFYWIREVVAWMPLPKPYKEDDHETD